MVHKLVINGKQLSFERGETILEVAQNAGIYIPTLCARPDLPSLGACRLCIVKVDGVRGYRTSCTMPAEDSMVISTATPEIQAIRRNVLELILSEHPSICIVCDDKDQCEKMRKGEFKAGRVIGCFTCSKKDRCELRELADYLRIGDIRYPLLYKNLPLERSDPFIVRDYNLCILCGRCVRACQDVLGYSAISFTKRGHEAKVGTMLEQPHINAGCHFCGHCIDVCPTGALTARGSKWYGEPENSVSTTCILCSHGCQMVVDTKWNKVVSVHPVYDISARREYCVKGRFCIPALVNGRKRLKYPTIKKDNKLVSASWDEAIEYTANVLQSYQTDDIGVYISPFLTDEAIFVLTKFAKEVAGSKFAYDEDGLRKMSGIKVLYLTQQVSQVIQMDLDTIILQDIYRSHFQEFSDVILPACTFTEENGTKTCSGFVINQVSKAVDPPGLALPDWKIVNQLAGELKLEGFGYENMEQIQNEMRTYDLPMLDMPMVPKNSLTYRGIAISDKVEEFKLFLASKYDLQVQDMTGDEIAKKIQF